MLKRLVEKVENMHEQIENFSRETETVRKSKRNAGGAGGTPQYQRVHL